MIALITNTEGEQVELFGIVNANQHLRRIGVFHNIVDDDFFQRDLQVTDTLILNQELLRVLLQLRKPR